MVSSGSGGSGVWGGGKRWYGGGVVVPVAGYLRAQIDAGEVLDKVLKAHPKDAVVRIHDVEPFLVLATCRGGCVSGRAWRRRSGLRWVP